MEKGDEKKEREGLGKTFWNAACLVKRGKKLDFRWYFRASLPPAIPSLPPPVTSYPSLFSNKNNENVVLVTWIKTNPAEIAIL